MYLTWPQFVEYTGLLLLFCYYRYRDHEYKFYSRVFWLYTHSVALSIVPNMLPLLCFHLKAINKVWMHEFDIPIIKYTDVCMNGIAHVQVIPGNSIIK